MHKSFQRIFTFILALILALGFLSMVAMTVSAASVYGGTVSFSEFFKPTIKRQPESAKATQGQTVTISVEAKKKSSKDILSYQWYCKDKGASKFTLAAGYTEATYAVTMTAAVDGRQVYCVVSSKYGAQVQTSTATITMAEAVKITKHPTPVQAAKGEKFSVSVEASGDGLTYRWYYKDKGAADFKKSSATAAVYSATMDASWDGRQVYCAVTDRYGNTAKSDTVTVSMKTHKHSYATTFTTDSKGHWYQCSGCDERGSYASHDFENACDKDCSVCGYSRNTDHTYPQSYKNDKTHHWKVCTGCGVTEGKEAHVPGAAATETTDQTCKVCGYVIAPATGSTKPTDVPTEPTQPTTTQPATVPTAPATTPTQSTTAPTQPATAPTTNEDGQVMEEAPDTEFFWWLIIGVVIVSVTLIVIFIAWRRKDRNEW